MTNDDIPDAASLAQRIESADCGSRELDTEIAQAVGFDFQPEFGGAITRSPPAYSTSLDAAMTLVPDLGGIDGQRFDLFNFARCAAARVYSDEDADYKATAKTAPLALCAAALKSRAHAEKGGE